MIPKHELDYEEELLSLIRAHGRTEDYHRTQRQGLEDRLRTLLAKRGAQRLQNGCPPAFILDCVLEDGTMCPYWHDTGDEGVCVKVKEEEDKT